MAANLTRNGVCYDLSGSPYFQDWRGYRFYFSSEPHRRRFFEKARIREEWLTDSMSRRFHTVVSCDILAVVQLYEQVETRGFRVVSDCGIVYHSIDDFTFKVVVR